MGLANELDQSAVAYESGPKEENVPRGLHDGDNKQFGKNKMPQDQKKRHTVERKPTEHSRKMHTRHGRHREHR